MDLESPANDSPVADQMASEAGLSPRTRTQRVLAVSVAVLLAAGAAAVLVGTGKKSPEKELAEVRSFVATRKTARVTGRTVERYGSGDEEAGSTSTDRTKVEGELRIPNDSHVISDDGDYLDETIIIGRQVYDREGDDRADLRRQQWSYESLDSSDFLPPELAKAGLSETDVRAVADLTGSLSSLGMPVDLPAMLAIDKKVTRTGTAELTLVFTLRDFLSAKEEEVFTKMSEEFGDPNTLDDKITAVVNHGPEGRLDHLTLDSKSNHEGETEEFHLELAFTGWGEDVDISAPKPDALDRTPGIDEAGVAQFKDFTVMAPDHVPASYLLTDLTADPGDAEAEMCAGVELTYTPASEVNDQAQGEEEGYARLAAAQVTIDETDTSCKYFEEPTFSAPGRPAAAGSITVTVYDGLPNADFGEMELKVPGVPPVISVVWRSGDTSFVISGRKPAAEILDFAAHMAPLDLSRQPVQQEPLPG